MKKKHNVKIIVIALSVICAISLIAGSYCTVTAFANAAWEYKHVLPEKIQINTGVSTDIASDDTIVLKNIDCNINVIKWSESESQVMIDDSSNVLDVDYSGVYDYIPFINPFVAKEDIKLEEVFMEKTHFTDKPNTTEVWIEKNFIKLFSINFGLANMTVTVSDNFAGNIKFENCAGDINFFEEEEPLKINSLSFVKTAGNIEGKIHADSVFVESSAGNLKITNQNQEFSLIKITNSAGNINLKIPSDTKGKFEKTGSLGNMDLFFSRVTNGINDFTHVINGGEGDSEIYVENAFGNIHVGKIE